MADSIQGKPEPTEFQRFHAALSRAIKVPKAEILRREREDKEARKRARKRKPKGFIRLDFILAFAVIVLTAATVMNSLAIFGLKAWTAKWGSAKQTMQSRPRQ